jgi:hypothetical protein
MNVGFELSPLISARIPAIIELVMKELGETF